MAVAWRSPLTFIKADGKGSTLIAEAGDAVAITVAETSEEEKFIFYGLDGVEDLLVIVVGEGGVKSNTSLSSN